MTGASVNFKAVKSASHAVSHSARTVGPSYLLPPDKSLGTICVLDDKGMVASTLEAKIALASRQALREKNYSPVWEGILNLPRPEVGFDAAKYKQNCSNIVKQWCSKYEQSTGHKVLRADIHLDEGHMVDGEALLNAHAHIIADRTTEKGRVIKLSPKQLRELQTATAEVTGLERGESSLKTGRKHIGHHQYKYLAERGKLEAQQQIDDLKATHGTELEKEKVRTSRIQKLFLKDTEIIAGKDAEIARYKAERDALKASGTATQQDYQALKKKHEAVIEALNQANQKVEKMEKQITQLEADKAKLATEAAKWAAKANAYQAEKAKGTPAHLIDTTQVQADPPAPSTRGGETAMPTSGERIQNMRARLQEATRTPAEQPKTRNPDISTPKPEKSLKEALKDSLKEFRDGWMDFIKYKGFTHAELDTSQGQYRGTILDKDDLFAVQKTGRHTCVIHLLSDLDMNPELENPDILIRYRDGVGQVSGQQPEQYKYPSPGDR